LAEETRRIKGSRRKSPPRKRQPHTLISATVTRVFAEGTVRAAVNDARPHT
jgi:hypothetical protein